MGALWGHCGGTAGEPRGHPGLTTEENAEALREHNGAELVPRLPWPKPTYEYAKAGSVADSPGRLCARALPTCILTARRRASAVTTPGRISRPHGLGSQIPYSFEKPFREHFS